MRLTVVVLLAVACTKHESLHADDSTRAVASTTVPIPTPGASLSASASGAVPSPSTTSTASTSGSALPRAAATCPKAPPGDVFRVDSASCKSDAECKDKPEGRCKSVNIGHGRTNAQCTYDDCQSDTDCPSPTLCLCGAGYTGRNICLPSNCHEDADCKGTACGSVPSETNGGYISNGRYCRTARDQCKDAQSCGPQKTCGYVTSSHRWECMPARYPFPG